MWLHSDYVFLSFCELLVSQWDCTSYYRNYEEEGDVKITYRHIQRTTASVYFYSEYLSRMPVCLYSSRVISGSGSLWVYKLVAVKILSSNSYLAMLPDAVPLQNTSVPYGCHKENKEPCLNDQILIPIMAWVSLLQSTQEYSLVLQEV